MALRITDDCINCDACVSECPNTAIYEPDEVWTYADGTKLTTKGTSPTGNEIDPSMKNDSLSEEFYFIVADKCTECKGFHDEAQCVTVCPVDCIEIDEELGESEELLFKKQAWLHPE